MIFQAFLQRKDAFAKTQDVGVVVFPRQTRHFGRRADGRADARVAVGGDRHADAGVAHEDARVGLPGQERVAYGLRQIRVIHGFGAIGAAVDHGMALFPQVPHDFRFEQRRRPLHSSVVVANSNSHGVVEVSPWASCP